MVTTEKIVDELALLLMGKIAAELSEGQHLFLQDQVLSKIQASLAPTENILSVVVEQQKLGVWVNVPVTKASTKEYLRLFANDNSNVLLLTDKKFIYFNMVTLLENEQVLSYRFDTLQTILYGPYYQKGEVSSAAVGLALLTRDYTFVALKITEEMPALAPFLTATGVQVLTPTKTGIADIQIKWSNTSQAGFAKYLASLS